MKRRLSDSNQWLFWYHRSDNNGNATSYRLFKTMLYKNHLYFLLCFERKRKAIRKHLSKKLIFLA